MDADRWSLVKDRFSEALGLPLAERRRFLHHLDDATRSEVEALLEAAEPTSGPLDLPFDLSLLGIDLPGETEAGQTEQVRSLAGARVGPYLIEEKIGQGGMGDVYRARRADGLFERVVALKVVRADTETVLARFAAERRILGTLEHPGIARLIAAGSETEGPTAGRPWLALEYVDGVPLTEAVRDLGLRERLRLVAEIAEAVHHAHRRLVVHRDLKPSNVLVVEREDGTRSVKLLDFGIAKIVDPEADPGLTQIDGRSPRTRAYAAPEQVAGQPVTTATDVYGLGLLLFEVLTAARPFPIDQGLYTLESAILHDDPPRPSAAAQPEAGGLDPKRLHGDLDAICLKALAKEPDARYASAEAFAADLERYLSGEPVEARAPSVGYRARRFVARHKAGVAATAVVIAALAVGLGAALWQANEAEAARAEAVAALDESETALARAEAVSDFLQSLFEANDYSGPIGDTLNSIELLALGVERAQEMQDAPEVQAQVLQAIGATYFTMDEFERADTLLHQALSIRKATLGPDHPDVAETLNKVGWLLLFTGDYDGAEARLREAATIQRATLPDPHLSTAENLFNLGTALRMQGNYDEAESVLNEAVAMIRRLPPGDGKAQVLSGALGELGTVVRLQGNYDEAEVHLREGLDVMRALWGDHHVEVATSMSNLAGLLQQAGKLAEAESLVVQAIAIDRDLLGEDHHNIAIAQGLLAQILLNKGELARAETLFLDTIARFRSTLGEGHPRIIPLLFYLGKVYQGREDYARAEPVLREALAAVCAEFGPENVQVGIVRKGLTDLYEAWGRPAESTECPAAPADA